MKRYRHIKEPVITSLKQVLGRSTSQVISELLVAARALELGG